MEPFDQLGRPGAVTSAIAADSPAGAVRAGEVETLYRDEFPGARRLAYLLCGDEAQAEDLAQDAFLRVASRVRRLREPAAFRAYLRRAVVNAVNSHFRHQGVVRRHLESEGAMLDRPADGPDLETRDALWEAVLELPARQRSAVVCRYYLDLSERDTAAALGVRVGTVKSSVSRALAALRGRLDSDEVIDHA